MRIHRIYCKSVSGEDSNFELDQSQSSHLSKVLRLQVNDEVEVFDGNGASALCLITSIDRKMTSLKRISEIIFSDVPKVKILMHPNISLTPHIGAATNEAQDRIGIELADKISEILG